MNISGKRLKVLSNFIFQLFLRSNVQPQSNIKKSLSYEKTLVFDSNYKLIYSSIDDAKINWSVDDLKYLKKKISRTDLEVRVLNKSLQSEYAKLGGMSEASLIETTPRDSVMRAKMIKPKEIKTTKVDTTQKKQ